MTYHENLSAGFRRSAERARSGRSSIARTEWLEQQAAKAERDAEFYGRMLRRSR